jgi:membrane protein DedA with SNARE-associated domain
MLLDASVTGALVNLATHLINDAGYAGVGALTLISAIIFVPGDEVTMLFAGFNVYEHNLTLVGIILAACIGDLLGATIAYVIGYLGLHEGLEKLPGPLKISNHGMDSFDKWFARWGVPFVAVSRIIPGGRAAGPYGAGIAKMPYWKFLPPATAGTIVWMTGLGLLGKGVGSQWQKWKQHLDYVDYVIVVIVVGLIAWFLYQRLWRAPREARAAIDSETGVES